MKKLLSISLIIMLFILSGCPNQTTPPRKNPTTPPEPPPALPPLKLEIERVENEIKSGKLTPPDSQLAETAKVTLSAQGKQVITTDIAIPVKAIADNGGLIYVWSLFRDDKMVEDLGFTRADETTKEFTIRPAQPGSGCYQVKCSFYFYNSTTKKLEFKELTSPYLSLLYASEFERVHTSPLESSLNGYKIQAVGDFNGDGRTDCYLNLPNFGQGANQQIWYGNKEGGFTIESLGPLGSDWTEYKVQAVGDFNGDGRTDLYLNLPNFGQGANQHIWYGKQTTGFTMENLGPLGSDWTEYKIQATGDFNGDGRTDLYLNLPNFGQGANQHIWYGRQTAGFTKDNLGPLGTDWSEYKIQATGDFNGDGMTDLYLNLANLGQRANQHIWYGRQTSGFTKENLGPLDSTWTNYRVHAVGDFNGDGRTDIYLNFPNFGEGANRHIWYGKKEGGFNNISPGPLDITWTNFQVQAVGDFNGDGKTDCYLNLPNLGQGANQHIWYGKWSGKFEDHLIPPLENGLNGYEVQAVGDFNGDGKTDIYLNLPNLGQGANQHIWYGR